MDQSLNGAKKVKEKNSDYGNSFYDYVVSTSMVKTIL